MFRSVTAPKIAGSLNVLKAVCDIGGLGSQQEAAADRDIRGYRPISGGGEGDQPISGGSEGDQPIRGQRKGDQPMGVPAAAATTLVMSSSIYACLGNPRLASYAAVGWCKFNTRVLIPIPFRRCQYSPHLTCTPCAHVARLQSIVKLYVSVEACLHPKPYTMKP